MSKIVRFGILGPGRIANRFASAFQYVPEAKVYAIASHDASRALEFALTHNVEKQYTAYEDLLNDPLVDVVYIATPHPFHFEQTMLCLEQKKPVLCEKPLAMNFRQVSEMVSASQRGQTFLMEGMWSRFFPVIHKTLELLNAGAIGDVKFLHADFGFAAPVNLEGRVYKLTLGGGAQLDVGVYPMFLALLMLGKPDGIKSYSQLASTGADTSTSALFHYSNGAMAHIFSSIVTDSVKDAHIMGTLGRITIQSPWHKSQLVSLRLNSGESTDFAYPHSGNGFEFQIREVAHCVAEKKIESEQMPHRLSLMMAEVSDEIRRQGGIRYRED